MLARLSPDQYGRPHEGVRKVRGVQPLGRSTAKTRTRSLRNGESERVSRVSRSSSAPWSAQPKVVRVQADATAIRWRGTLNLSDLRATPRRMSYSDIDLLVAEE